MLGPKSCCAPASLFSPPIRHLPPKTYASMRKFEIVAATDFSVDLHTGLRSSHLMLALAESAMFRHGRNSAVDIDNSVSSGKSAAWHSASHIPSFRFVSLGMPDNLYLGHLQLGGLVLQCFPPILLSITRSLVFTNIVLPASSSVVRFSSMSTAPQAMVFTLESACSQEINLAARSFQLCVDAALFRTLHLPDQPQTHPI